ncbi:MAG: heterodisulfide reductase-related iron-sulfur binding cluster [Defluviitaleaceae bacterium]|nr:heterodisulfide reductase-related iron-sulfur binding cluster [Defluviitaleaceae bacterium]
MEFLYYPGCTLSTTAKILDKQARSIAAALDLSFTEIENWQCCGATFPLNADEIAPKLAAVRALIQARNQNKPLVTLCAACHHVMKQVNHQAKNDADFRTAITSYDADLFYAGEATVLHFMEVLRDYVGFDALRDLLEYPLKGRKIGAYYGCMLLRPSDVMGFDDAENPQIFEEYIRALGAVPVSYPMRNECCGGYRAPEDALGCANLVERIAKSAAGRGAETLITACPLCLYQMVEHSGGAVDVCYFTEILAEALGVDDDDDDSND